MYDPRSCSIHPLNARDGAHLQVFTNTWREKGQSRIGPASNNPLPVGEGGGTEGRKARGGWGIGTDPDMPVRWGLFQGPTARHRPAQPARAGVKHAWQADQGPTARHRPAQPAGAGVWNTHGRPIKGCRPGIGHARRDCVGLSALRILCHSRFQGFALRWPVTGFQPLREVQVFPTWRFPSGVQCAIIVKTRMDGL